MASRAEYVWIVILAAAAVGLLVTLIGVLLGL
jgi:hypothetical protein